MVEHPFMIFQMEKKPFSIPNHQRLVQSNQVQKTSISTSLKIRKMALSKEIGVQA